MSANTIRTLLTEKGRSRKVLDHNTGETPFWSRGDDLEIEVGLCNQDGSFLAAADVGDLEIVIRENSEDEEAPKRMVANLTQADCDPSFTAADWELGGALFTVSWDRDEAALEVPSGKSSQRYLCYVAHIDDANKRTTYGAFEIEVRLAPRAAPTLTPPPPFDRAADYLDDFQALIASLSDPLPAPPGTATRKALSQAGLLIVQNGNFITYLTN